MARHTQTMYAAFDRAPFYRVLAKHVAPLVMHAQAHAFKEIGRLKLPFFRTIIAHRAAYEEIGLSGLPPHFAEPGARRRPKP